MTTSRDPDRLIHAFVLEGAEQLDDQVYDAVRAEIDQKRQRVVIGPWRFPNVSKLVPIGLGAAAVIAVLFLGSQFIGSPTSNVGGPASQPPASAAPSEAPASAAPASAAPASAAPASASAAASATSPPPLTQTFTSTQHDISMSYPEGWTAKAATEPWTAGTSLFPFGEPRGDFLYDTTLQDSLFLAIGSQPIGDSSPEDWIMEMGASPDDCPATEPITVGGASGRIGSGGSCHIAVVTTDGRGYWISLYRGDVNPSNVAPYDRAWFEEVLATVQLHPEDAVDVAPSATP